MKHRVIKMFPDIINRDAFLNREHPVLNPDSVEYIDYWRKEKKRSIEGWWVMEDINHWRWMNPLCYFYINHWDIMRIDELNNARFYGPPDLTDNEWIITSYYTACDGFSGFTGDDNISCHYLLKKFWDNQKGLTDKSGSKIGFSEADKRKLEKLQYVKRSDGKYKDFIEPFEYLKLHQREPLGYALYQNSPENGMIFTARGNGKDLEENTLVYKEDGAVPIKDIEIGDFIYGGDGKLTKVIDKALYYNQMQYKVTLDDGREIECGAGHLWTVYNVGADRGLVTLPLKEIYKKYLSPTERPNGRKDKKYFLPINGAIERATKNLLIDPYFLGLWLGDGSKHQASITTADDEIKDYCYEYAEDFGQRIYVASSEHKTTPTYVFRGKDGGGNKIFDNLKELNLINNKHIPKDYLYASYDQKLELLKGLMDSDGYCTAGGGCEFVTTIEEISESVKILLRELGMKYSYTTKDGRYKNKDGEIVVCKKVHRFTILTNELIFKLERKRNSQKVKLNEPTGRRRSKVAIVNIEPTEVKPSVCIGVDNDDSLFVAGDYIVTHNSFIKSSDCGREFTFGGAKYYDNDMFPQLRTTIGECMVGAGDPSKTLELCYKIEHGLKHFKGEYVNGERLIPAPFSKQAVGTFDVGKTYKHKYKKKVKGNWKDVSDGSVIYIVNYGSDVDAGASKRLSKQYVDEVGLIENVDQMHGVSKFSKQAGGIKFGKTISSGTGGSFDKGMAAKRMFYNPEQYEIYSIEDYWENKGRIGLFLPAYYSLRQYKDSNGNTIAEEAIEHLLEERKRLASFVDPLPLIQEKMFMPLVPSEMFYSIQENIFPVDLVVERLNEIEGDSILLNDYSAGLFRWTNSSKNEVRWVESVEARKRAIIDLSLDKYQDKSGVVLIYEHPDAEIEDFLYKVVYDPYKIDGKGESYASILVYKGIPTINSRGMRDTIVAEFLGRPKTVEEAHQVAIQLAIYFKTKVLFEDNIPGFKKWCIQEKYYHLLQEEPYRAMKDGLKDKKRTHKVGVTMSGTLKTHCLQRLRSWLLEPRDVDDERITRTNVHELRSLRLLTEFMSFGEGNFDHISAMLLLMLWIDQDGKVVKVTNIQERVDDFDEFFKRRIRGLHNPHFS